MAKIKQIFYSLIVISLLAGLNGGPLVASAQNSGTSNQFTHPDTINTDWEINQEIPDTYELAGDNETFKLYVNKTSLAFKVVDKRSGYVWHSSLDEFEASDRLNKSWKAFASSGISIDYLDPKAVNKRVSITNSDVSLDVKSIDQGFQALVKFNEYSITVGLIVQLEPGGVRVEIPSGSIKEENRDFKLGLVYAYPFLGATREDSVPGYMFIPDGSGSLIRFNATTKAKNIYYQRYYGSDLGMITYLPFDPQLNRPYKISVPVFGLVHGYKQNAFVSIVEKGAAYGEIQAHPSGIITNFNYIHSAFVYNESYFQATNRSGSGVTTLQRKTNAFDVVIHFRFLTGNDSDYVGMARSYQQYLIEKEILQKIPDQNSSIGIRLEFLGGDKEKVLLWNRLIPMTSISQMSDILGDLGIKNTDVIYYGWQPLGASSMPPGSLKIDSDLGTLSQLRSLAERISSDGGNLYLYLDPQAALRDEKGYSPRNDLAMSITNSNIIAYARQKVNYFLNLDALSNHYSSLSKDVFSEQNIGLAIDNFGSVLYSDFKNNHFLNREDAIEKYQELMENNKGSTSFYMPNDYMFGFMSAYYDIPLTSNGYIYTTDLVPFLQIVFAGYIPYYGRALNFSSNLQEDLLRQVDFGVYPSYFLTHEITAKILNTSSNWIYTSSYAQWKDEIQQSYQWLDNLLGPVKGQVIVSRDVFEDGVVAITYANNKQIIVNYNERPYSNNGISVNGKDAIIREVMP